MLIISESIKEVNRINEKDIYKYCRGATLAISKEDNFFPTDSTTTPKSKYDNVVGYINVSKTRHT